MTTGMTRGRFIAVVGPSGVGKDSVINGLCMLEPGLVPVRRAITRPPDSGGEAHLALDVPAFEARRDAGDFVLHWGAHGLFYGIPQTELAPLQRGRDVIANLSRGVLARADQLIANVVVLHLTATPDTLARRLGARGRETVADIAARLAREGAALPAAMNVITVANDGALGQTVAAARTALYRAKP